LKVHQEIGNINCKPRTLVIVDFPPAISSRLEELEFPLRSHSRNIWANMPLNKIDIMGEFEILASA
jgi:hypothetical protein